MDGGIDNIGPMESVFQSIGAPPRGTTDGVDQQDYNARVFAMLEDTNSYNESDLAPDREEADLYYKGIAPALGGADDDSPDEDDVSNRTSIVATEVRDTILAIMPNLVRIFTSQEHPVTFVPNTEADVDFAEQATDYVSYLFWEDNPGFLIIHSILKDTMNKRIGIVKWDTRFDEEYKEQVYRHITQEQYQYLIARPNTEVVSEKSYPADDVDIPAAPAAPPTPDGGPAAPPPESPPLYDLTVRITRRTPMQIVEAVPPDEFRIDRNAKSIKDSSVVGHLRSVTRSYLVELGYSVEEVANWPSGAQGYVGTEERELRNPGLGTDSNVNDMVEYGEWFVRVDKNEDGKAELRYICTAGNEIVEDEEVAYTRMALFGCDPEPHTAVGGSMNILTRDLQKLKTNVLRNTLDSLAASIHARMVVVENQVNMDDVLSDGIGDPIRVKAPGMVTPIVVPFAGEPALQMMAYLDVVRQSRTGVSEASKGLDPKVLQSTAIKGVEMVMAGAQDRIELIARILAETGFKDLFKGLLIETINNPAQGRVVKLRGKWVTVQPDAFDPTMKVRVNPNLGRGSDQDKFAMLAQISAKQEMVMGMMGIDNPVCGPIEWVNTMTDMLALAGMRNISRYFKVPSPDDIHKMAAAKAAAPNPAMVLANNEVEKTRSKTVETIADNQRKDREHEDKMDLSWASLAAKTEVDAARVKTDGHAILSDADKFALGQHMALHQHTVDTAVDVQKHNNQLDQQDADRDQQGEQHENELQAGREALAASSAGEGA